MWVFLEISCGVLTAAGFCVTLKVEMEAGGGGVLKGCKVTFFLKLKFLMVMTQTLLLKYMSKFFLLWLCIVTQW